MNYSAIIFVGSGKPEAMWELLGEPLIGWVLDSVGGVGIEEDRVGIVADGKDNSLTKYVSERGNYRIFGDLSSAADALLTDGGNVLAMSCDTPFVNCDTLAAALNEHTHSANDVTVIDTAVCWFKEKALKQHISAGIRDAAAEIAANGGRLGTFTVNDPNILLPVNNRADQLRLNIIAKMAVIGKWLDEGVEFVSTDGVIIEKDVVIGKDTKILPGTILRGRTVIGENCVLGPNTLIEDCRIGNGVVLNSVQAYESQVGDRVKAGPFVQLRPGTKLHEGVKIGDFVEIKNSEIGVNTAVAHLTYLGDSDVGKGVNFGCGCVTANYDGVNKFRTKIGDYAFIGCNTNLIAPVEIGENAATGAGSTITKDVPPDSLAVERAQTKITEHWEKNSKRIRKA